VSRKIYFSKSVSEDALKVFNQIANFENYSSYIPGCTKSELIQKQDEFEIGKLEFNFLLKDYSIKSKNVLSKNNIQIEQVDGPFNSFKGEWNILKKNNSETLIEFNAEFELPFLLNNLLPENVINNFCEVLINAFIKRL
tara:strand:- start:1697 stop:2113 length:417 start_codon:yes stop_codon:yes gene_type:complete